MNYKFESLKAIPQESKCRQSIQLDLLQQLGPAGSSSTISFSTNFSATKQKKKKRGKKIELETNIETETKANYSPYLVRPVINFPKTPNPETIPNAHLKGANLTPPSPRKHSES
jgi:hypothetical protein